MTSPTSADLTSRRRILVADEDPKVVAFIIQTLRQDGHMVLHAYDGLSATELAFALDEVHLVISNTRVNGLPGVDLVHLLRERLPELPILYIANIDRSTPAIEAQLPADVPILREPFTAEELRAIVGPLLSAKRKAALEPGRWVHFRDLLEGDVRTLLGDHETGFRLCRMQRSYWDAGKRENGEA